MKVMHMDNERNGKAIALNHNYTIHLLLIFLSVRNIDINTIGIEGYNILHGYSLSIMVSR